ncbi:hypothetical protein RQP46_006749 [Phenoliferia psychrophenolica]
MEGEESEDRQAVVDALVDAVGQRDALLTFFWLERDPAALSLPGPDAELVRASPARDLENWLRQSGYDRETEPMASESDDLDGAEMEKEAMEVDERAVKVERVDAAMAPLDQDEATRRPLDADVDHHLEILESCRIQGEVKVLWARVGADVRPHLGKRGSLKEYLTEAQRLGLVRIGRHGLEAGAEWVSLANAQLCVRGIPIDNRSDAVLEQELKVFLGTYLEPPFGIEAVQFSPSGRAGHCHAFLRLDPRFDAVAFDKGLKPLYPLLMGERHLNQQDLATYPSNILPATFWDPHLVAPTPSFTRTIPVSTTFGYVPSDLASRVLSDPTTPFPSDPVRRAQLVAFLESQRDGTQTEHYDAFLRQVEDFSERNREFMRVVEDFRGKERRREEEPSSQWQRVRGDEGRAAKWGPD